MQITSLELWNFRNIAHASISFSEKVNVLYGKNAQGKTNLAESIGMFSYGRSFRGAKEKEMIAFDADAVRMRLSYRDREKEHTLRYDFSESKRICQKNGANLTKVSELVGKLQTVIFAPSHLSLVSGEPLLRRNFLDMALIPYSASHIEDLRQYKRALLQKNAYLKQLAKEHHEIPIQKEDALLESLRAQLTALGVRIANRRKEYLEQLERCAKKILFELSDGKESLKLEYQGALTKEEYEANARRLFLAEQYRKTTLYGAHRDDFCVQINDKSAKDYASQGQQRSVALALKLAEGELLYQKEKEYPVFLLDDIFSELDEGRKRYIMQGLQDRQVILTTCDESVTKLWEDATVYSVENGVFTQTQTKP